MSYLEQDQSRALQKRLLEVFHEFNVNVGVGITKEGVKIISQDKRVHTSNVGQIKAF